MPLAPLLGLFCFLISQRILVVIFAVLTAKQTSMRFFAICSNDVDPLTFDDFLTTGSALAVTAVESHLSGYTLA